MRFRLALKDIFYLKSTFVSKETKFCSVPCLDLVRAASMRSYGSSMLDACSVQPWQNSYLDRQAMQQFKNKISPYNSISPPPWARLQLHHQGIFLKKLSTFSIDLILQTLMQLYPWRKWNSLDKWSFSC